jgi:acidic leucine-rich nuclear phosphoprotein 32 family protein A/C/D
LNDNFLKGEELSKLQIYPKLVKLRLSNNQINSFDEIEILGKFPNLQILDLMDCPIVKKDNYREEIFKILPNLQVLDMTYQDGELYESERNGYFYF